MPELTRQHAIWKLSYGTRTAAPRERHVVKPHLVPKTPPRPRIAEVECFRGLPSIDSRIPALNPWNRLVNLQLSPRAAQLSIWWVFAAVTASSHPELDRCELHVVPSLTTSRFHLCMLWGCRYFRFTCLRMHHAQSFHPHVSMLVGCEVRWEFFREVLVAGGVRVRF